MAQQYLDTAPGGDSVGEALAKANGNFAELYGLAGTVSEIRDALALKQPLDVDLVSIAALTTTYSFSVLVHA